MLPRAVTQVDLLATFDSPTKQHLYVNVSEVYGLQVVF